MNSVTVTASSKPWYRERWPWLLAIMPTVAVIAGSTTLWLAIKSNDGLVVDDYYKEGQAINQLKERDDLTRSLGISAQLLSKAGIVQVLVSGHVPNPEGKLILKIIHPTHAGDDHEIILKQAGGSYYGQLPELTAAKYHLQLTPEQGNWRLAGEWHPGSPLLLLPTLSN